MVRTVDRLAALLEEKGYVGPKNALEVSPESPKHVISEYIWYDKTNKIVRHVCWGRFNNSNPDCVDLDLLSTQISPMRSLSVLNEIERNI